MKFFHYNKTEKPAIGLLWEAQQICLTDLFNNHPDLCSVDLAEKIDPIRTLIMQDFFTTPRMQKLQENLQKVSLDQYMISGEITYCTPIINPARILAIGRNYAKHAAELGNPVPDKLLFFDKSITTLVAHNKPVIVPSWVEGRVDHEIELAVILKKGGKRIDRENAMSCVAGYSICNDVTARDLQAKAKQAGHPWFKSKNPDTFGPMGPYFVPEHFVPDPHELELKLTVNGELRQKGNTQDMIYRVPDIISILSTYITLLPGDIIITGTPEGVSPLHQGDVMEASITHLGKLRNSVIVEQTSE